jgi:hypothetical protein
LDADTNADRLPDVWITYQNGSAAIQDEDTDFDGQVDQRFDLATDEPIELNGDRSPPSLDGLPKIGCSGFSDFWQR